MEENSEKSWKIQKKIVKRQGKYGRKQEKIWQIRKINCEMIWKIWKKIVKSFGKYRRKL